MFDIGLLEESKMISICNLINYEKRIYGVEK